MKHAFWKKILSGFLIFFLLFSFTFRIPFSQFFMSVFAGDIKYYDIVSIIVEEDIYGSIKGKLERYAHDIEGVLENTKVVILPVPNDASAFKIASLNESLYFEGYKSLENVNFESKLVGTVFVGKIPLPIAFDSGNFSKSVLPFVDFEEKEYIYNHETNVYERDMSQSNEVKADIWHGFISPNTGVVGTNIQKINDYLDKNHDFYIGAGNFTSTLGVINANKDDEIPKDYEPFVFYYDQIRENQAIDVSKYKGYLAYNDNIEDITYKRYSKELAEKVKEYVMTGDDTGINDLIKKVGGQTATSSSPDLTNSSDILSRYVTQSTTKNFLEIFNEGTISDFRTFVHNAGRYNKTGSEVNVDLVPFLVTVLDLISAQVIKDANTKTEEYIDKIITDNNSRKIAIPTRIESNDVLSDSALGNCGGIYMNFLYGKKAEDITDASQCSIYRGSLTDSGTLVEANRAYNIDNNKPDIGLCSSDKDKNGKVDTAGYWGGNSPLNLDINGFSEGKFFLGARNTSLSITPLYDVVGAQAISDVSKTPSPLQCYEDNFLLGERKQSFFIGACQTNYSIPLLGGAVNWNCATNNIQYNYKEKFDDIYKKFGTLSLPSCTRNNLWLDGNVVKTQENISDLCLGLVKTVDYKYKSIPSIITHKSPTADDLKAQVNSMITPSLPIDKKRYIDYIASDGTYQKMYYPQLFSVEGDMKNNMDYYKEILKKNLDNFSSTYNAIIQNTNPNKLSGQDKEIYLLLKSGVYNGSKIDLYNNLSTQKNQTYVQGGETKDVNYVDTLSFSLYWKNLNSPSAKYKFIFENYLSDEFGGNDFNFHLPKNKKSYEIAYLGAPGDSKNMYIKVDPEGKGTNPYSQIIANNTLLNTSLLSYNITSSNDTTAKSGEDMFKCSPPDGVPIWEWIPAIVCRLKDMLPPKISISDGECGPSLLTQDEITELNECDGDVNKNGVNDCIETKLKAGKLSLESDSSRYYYNKSGTLKAVIKDKDGKQANFDNSTKVKFQLQKIIVPQDSQKEFNATNTQTVYESSSETDATRKEVSKYINFKNLNVQSDAGEADLFFSTKGKDADLYFQAFIDIKNSNGNTELFLESEKVKIEVRGDKLSAGTYSVSTGDSSLGKDSISASQYTNIYLVDGGKTTISTNSSSLQNSSLASEKLVISLSNYSSAGNKLEIAYPLTVQLLKDGVAVGSGTTIAEGGLDIFKGLFNLSESGDYTLKITDSLKNTFSKNFKVLPSLAVRADIKLGTSSLEQGGVITTNIITLYDAFNNVAIGDIYNIEGKINGSALVFNENEKDSIAFQMVEGYRTFRLKSKSSSGQNSINFIIKDDAKKTLFSQTVNINVLQEIKLDIQSLQSEVKVGGEKYAYKVVVRDPAGNKLTGISSRAYIVADPSYGTLESPYFELKDGEGIVYFRTKNLAGQNIKLEFQVEGINLIAKRYIDILPEKPVKIDISLSKPKMEASKEDFSLASVSLKDRYGNIVFSDNTSQFKIELLDKYKTIVSFDNLNKVAKEGRQEFKISGTDIPGRAYFKVSVVPDISKNTFSIAGQGPFSEDILTIPGFISNGTLSETGKKFFEEVSGTLYKSKFSSLSSLQSSDAYKNLLSSSLQSQLNNLWQQTNKITIIPESENATSIETFYFWSKGKIVGNKYNSLYTTLLGASYGDITVEDYLAGSLLFDRDNRALAVTSLLNNPYKYNDVVSFGSNGFIKKVYDTKDLSQNISSSVSLDSDSNLKVSFQNSALGTFLGEAYFNFDKANLLLQKCSNAGSDFSNCDFSDKKTSILLKSLNEGYITSLEGGDLILKNSLSEEVFRVNKDGKITNKSGFYLVLDDSSKNISQFFIKSSDKVIGLLGVNFVNMQFTKTKNQNLVPNYKQSLKNSIIFFLHSDLYSAREIFDGKNYTYFIYYNDPFSTDLQLDPFSQEYLNSYENFIKESGVGWKEGNKTLLGFATGKSVGEATKDYQSFSLINLGDPVIALKNIKKTLPGTTKERSFDATVGELITKDSNILSYKVFDYNSDDRKDIVVYKKDGYVGLYENEKADSHFRDLGHLAYLRDAKGKNIFEAGDFSGDGYDDIFFVNNAGKAFLLNNISKDFSRYSLESNFSLSGNIIRVRVFDMDHDGKDDIVTLDDSGEIHIFYGGGTSTNPKFTKSLVGNGYGLELSNITRDTGGLVYFNGLYQMPQTPDTSALLSSSNAYLAQLQNNITATATDTTNIYAVNEGYVDNLIFEQLPYTPVSLRDIVPTPGSINQSDISSSYQNTTGSLDAFINSNDNYVGYTDSYNSTQNTTFIKSQYAESQGIKVEKQYTDKNGGTLKVGDKIKVNVTLKNISGKNLSDMSYVESVESPFTLESDFKFISEDGLKAVKAPSNYAFMVEGFNLQDSVHFSYEMNTLSMKFGYLQVGLFEEGEAGDDPYGDIVVKPNEKNCGDIENIYRSTGGRSYQKGEKQPSCSGSNQVTPSSDYSDTNNNNIPDYIDNLLTGNQQAIADYADKSKETLFKDSDGDGIPDSEDSIDNYNDEEGLDSLGSLAQAVDKISSQMDTIIEGFGCGFGGGACFANPLNWAPLAPGSAPTLFGIPLGPLTPNTGIPIFSALTGLQMMCGPSPCCIPVTYPVSPLAYVPGPACGLPSAGGYLGTWAPTNYVRMFVTPTLTGGVGTAICFGGPAIVAGYANPPGLHPIVPGGNCVVAAMPLLGCKDDGSDGDVGSQGFSQTSSNGAYDIINGNCDGTSSSTETGTGNPLDNSLVKDYVTYKKTGVKSKSLEERIKEMFSTVAKQNNSSSSNFGQNPLINLEGGGANDMSLSLDINTDALINGKFSDVIQFNMKRVWAFPDFLMEWVTRQIEEIVTKLTDFPTLFIILPDFSGIMDSSWENFTTKVSDAFNKGKTKQENKDKALYSSLEKLKKEGETYCSGDKKDDLMCTQINSKISRLERKNTFSSQTISGISEVYQFLSQMPFISIEPEVVSINIPRVDQTTLDKALIEWRITRDNWQNEIDTAKESWSLGALCNQAVESEKIQCQKDNAIKNKVILNADALITSLERNIEVLEDYKNFPEKLNKLITKKEERLNQILCNIESISQITGGRIEKNGKRFKAWVELYILIKAVLKSWQLLIDVFIDYEASCHQCKNERDDLLYFIFKIISMIIPKIPVIQFPKWPDIILDLHNIRAGLVIYMPEFKFNLRPFVIPSLPSLTLPTVPNVNIRLPSLPILPTFELPELPDLPTLPKVELPDLPPPPKLPKLFSSLEGILNILKLITKVMCILKSSPFVPEWRAGDQIAFITERNGYLPTDFLNLSLPQISYPFVDAIKVTTYVNLEFDNEFIVEMVRQILMPLNTMTNNIVNMTDWNIPNIDFSDKTPQDIDVNVKLNGTIDSNLGASSSYGKKFIENFVYNSVKNIVMLVHTLDTEKSKELSISDFKFVIAQELAKNTIKDDPKLEELRNMWQGVLVYDFAQENEIIKNQKQDNKEKFDTIRNIINTEKNETKKQKGVIKKLKVSSGIKNIASFEEDPNITQYQESIQKYNSKFITQAKKLLANGENKEATQIRKQGEQVLSSVQGGLSAFQTKYDISQKNNKLLSATTTTATTSSSSASTSGATCLKTGANGQTYTYKGLYVVEEGVSYKLFDYIDQLKGDEEVTSIDYDNDGDEDLLYMVNGEIFLKINTKKSGAKEFVNSSVSSINSKDNKFFDGKDLFLESINGFKESEVTNGNINLVFSAPKRLDTSAFRVNFYDKVDKYTNLLDTNYIPENTKRHIIDAFAGLEEGLKKEETEQYTKYNNLGRISYIGTAPGITMETKEFVNIKDDILENRVVNIGSTTQIYSGKNGVRIGYIYSGDDITNTSNYKYLYLEKNSHIEFTNPVRVVSLDGDAYIETGKTIEYLGQDIMKFIGMPLLPDTKIYISDETRTFNASTNIEITYYDDTKLNIDWRDDIAYEIYNLGNISDSYLIQSAKTNDYYYANIYSLRGDIIGNYSNQILLSPQRESDIYAPEIKLDGAVRVPVYQKQIFDFTSSLYENTGIQGIKDFYIDFDLTKDTNGDGDPKNDRDNDKIKVIKTINSIKVEFGAYDRLFKKKIAIIAKDQNDNVGYKEIDFEVYSPIPSIKTENKGLINGFISEKLDAEPVNIYRYRGGIISKILDKSGQQKVNTFSGGIYDFTSLYDLSVGQGLAIKKDGKEIATIDESTGYITLKNPGYTISILPSSDTNVYPKISISDINGEVYYQYIKFSQAEDIKIVDSFEALQEKGIYVNFTDKGNYNYYEIPAGAPLNSGAVVIYGIDTGRNIPLFTLLRDGRIYTYNDKYKLEYASYGKNIVFKLMDREKGKEVARVMYVIDGNFMVE